MRKKFITIILAMCVVNISLAGCSYFGKEEKGESKFFVQDAIPDMEENKQSDILPTQPGGKGETSTTDNSDVLEHADIIGTVEEFTDSGCRVFMADVSEDEMAQPVQGVDADNGQGRISVVYNTETVFQLGIADIETGTFELQEVDKSEVKKQSNIYLYGEYQNDGTFLATKVIIFRTKK